MEETVAMWALTLSPAVTALAAMWTTEAYVLRYSLPAALGLARIYAVFAHHCTRKRPRAAWVVVGIVAVSFAGQGVMRGSDLVTGYMRGFRTGSTFASIERLGPESGLPIVVTSPVEYFVFPALRSEHWQSRLVYVSDAERCLEVANESTPDVILTLFTKWAPLQVEQRSDYLSRGQDFLVLDPLYEEGDTWLSICRKFDLKNLVRLYKSDEFVLYRWSRPLESGTQ